MRFLIGSHKIPEVNNTVISITHPVSLGKVKPMPLTPNALLTAHWTSSERHGAWQNRVKATGEYNHVALGYIWGKITCSRRNQNDFMEEGVSDELKV